MKDLQLDRQLFIIWRKACKLQDEIVADIQSCFSYVKIYVITWSPQYLESNFSRFFERPMKMREIQSKYGAGDFLVCIAECESNNHIDILRKYLNKIDCLDAIYVADSPKRINRDVTLLFGKNLEDLRNEGNFYDSEVEMISKDLEGAIGWNSLSHVFYVMNNTLSYCVLRNIDTISDDYDPNLGDIDLLVENLEEAKYVINGRKYLSSYLYPGMHHVNVAGKDIEFDMAFVGDDYMDKRWEKDILRSTRLILPPPPPHSVEIMVMSPVNQYFTLLYHAYVHKAKLSPDYHTKLENFAMPIGATYKADVAYSMRKLEEFLNENNYQFAIPTQAEGKINWKNLRYANAYYKLRGKYLLKRKPKVELRRIIKRLYQAIRTKLYK